VVDFTALGDAVNTASRLAGLAAAGEVLVSEDVYQALARKYSGAERRILNLRGKEAPFPAHVLRAAA
jgi:adenylate cyclase